MFYFNTIYSNDQILTFTSCSLPLYVPFFEKQIMVLSHKNCFSALEKLLLGEKSARETFFEGLKNYFWDDKSPIYVFKKQFIKGKLQRVKKTCKDRIIIKAPKLRVLSAALQYI